MQLKLHFPGGPGPQSLFSLHFRVYHVIPRLHHGGSRGTGKGYNCWAREGKTKVRWSGLEGSVWRCGAAAGQAGPLQGGRPGSAGPVGVEARVGGQFLEGTGKAYPHTSSGREALCWALFLWPVLSGDLARRQPGIPQVLTVRGRRSR